MKTRLSPSSARRRAGSCPVDRLHGFWVRQGLAKCVRKHDLHQRPSYGKVKPAPRAIHPRCAKRSDMGREMARVPNRLVGPFGARARRGLVVDDDPAGVGLEQEVDPSAQDLAIVLAHLHRTLDQHATRGEARVENCPKAPCTPDCVGGRHGAFAGKRRHESRRSNRSARCLAAGKE